jgi:hypothetical protein
MEELSQLDIAIRDSIEKVNAEGDDNPVYCGWALCFENGADVIFKYVKNTYPALLQFIEDIEYPPVNGLIPREIMFYLVHPRPENGDPIETRILHDKLSRAVDNFQKELRNYYRCEFIGARTRMFDNISTIMGAGILFKLRIYIDQTC